MAWSRDALAALEELCFTATEDLSSTAPVLSRPTLRAYFGTIPEDVLGLFGSPGRKTRESELLSSFLHLHGGHIASAAPVRDGRTGTSSSQYDFLFRRPLESIHARQTLRDQGYCNLALSDDTIVVVPVRDGPGRLPTTLTRIVVSNLPGDFMAPGVIPSLLESAGYTIGDEQGATTVAVRAEFGGEHKPELAVRFPQVSRLGVVVGIVRAPPDDPGLSRLPRHLDDQGSRISISVTGHKVPEERPRAEGTRVPGFVAETGRAANLPASAPMQTPTQRLDTILSLGRTPGDMTGLGLHPQQHLFAHSHASGPSTMEWESAHPLPLHPTLPGPSIMEVDSPHQAHAAHLTTSLGAPTMDTSLPHTALEPAAPSLHTPHPLIGAQQEPTNDLQLALAADGTSPSAFPIDANMLPPPGFPAMTMSPDRAAHLTPPTGMPGTTAVHDPAGQILREMQEAREPPRGYPDGPLAEKLTEWLIDFEIARDCSEATDILTHFYRTDAALWEFYAQDSSSPPNPCVQRALCLSTRQALTPLTVPSPAPSQTLTAPAPAQAVIAPNRATRPQGHTRRHRTSRTPTQARPRRATHDLPWWHSDRLRGPLPPGTGPRGRGQ